jgi:hypothetical protein
MRDMQIDPKVSMWIMIATAVMGVIAASGAQLTELFGTGVAQKIVTVDGLTLAIVGAVASVLHGYSAPQAGPLVNVPPPGAPPKAVIVLALALAALLIAGGAQAQTKRPTGDPIRDIQQAFQPPQQKPQGNPLDELARKIAALSLADFKYAAALAHATGNNVTAPCWDEWVKLISAQQQPLTDPATGAPMQEPDPHLATDMERLSEAIHQLQPNSELSVACAPMASAVQKDAATLISGVLSGGALGLFKLPIPIGVVP